MPKFCVGEPSAFSPEEIDDFVAFVLAGGEVNATGLKERVTRAPQIAFLRENDCLLGVGGLKTPSENHRQEIEKGSHVKMRVESVPFELGWVFILPSARNRKLSYPLCRALMTAANEGGIFATSRTNNIGMHRTLEKLGFVRSGSEWPSRLTEGNLVLFLRLR
jgi:RimJ/RimL family protein N-acetyltransferase